MRCAVIFGLRPPSESTTFYLLSIFPEDCCPHTWCTCCREDSRDCMGGIKEDISLFVRHYNNEHAHIWKHSGKYWPLFHRYWVLQSSISSLCHTYICIQGMKNVVQVTKKNVLQKATIIWCCVCVLLVNDCRSNIHSPFGLRKIFSF